MWGYTWTASFCSLRAESCNIYHCINLRYPLFGETKWDLQTSERCLWKLLSSGLCVRTSFTSEKSAHVCQKTRRRNLSVWNIPRGLLLPWETEMSTCFKKPSLLLHLVQRFFLHGVLYLPCITWWFWYMRIHNLIWRKESIFTTEIVFCILCTTLRTNTSYFFR